MTKKSAWSQGFYSHSDEYVRFLCLDEIDSTNVDCFVQFNIYNPYRKLPQSRLDSFKFILQSKKPYIVWEEGSFRQYPDYKKVGWFHYNNHGNFNNNKVDDYRWNKIKKDTNIAIKEWKSVGDNILIMGQVDYDSALISLYDRGYTSFIEWIIETIGEIRKHTDRPIIVRPHPKDLKNYELNCKGVIKKFKNVSISNNFSFSDLKSVSGGLGLKTDLKNAYCVITYNSNSIVEALTEGIPVFALDSGSVAYDISHKNLSDIEKLNYNININNWCSQVAYTMWNTNEIKTGETWSHLKPIFFKDLK